MNRIFTFSIALWARDPFRGGARACRYRSLFAVAGEADEPGEPGWGENGMPQVVSKRPVVYRRASHTRYQGRALLQLNYSIWFPERPKESGWDLRGASGDCTGVGGGSRVPVQEDDVLRSQPLSRGGTRSLFRPDGLVPGSERAERYFFWPMGIYEPGAMRQWGRHATAFVGRRHFDDADLLERYFTIEVNE